MRVHSTYEVNTHQQHNPFIPQVAGPASAGQQTAGRSFAEHLRIHFQQANAAPVTGDANIHMAISGIFWGFYPALKVQSKPESTLKDSAS